MIPVLGVETLATLFAAVVGGMTSVFPDFAVYAATGLVLGLTVIGIKRIVKGMR